ncbi:unnamed protein product [Pylaiella littoralis]
MALARLLVLASTLLAKGIVYAKPLVLSIALLLSGIAISSASKPRRPNSFPDIEEDVGGCLLLFGAYANGNMGDVIQSSTMARLFSNAAPENTCIWLGHPSKESPANGFHEGDFFPNNSTKRVSLGCDRESGEQVSRFKALIIGGGGIFESRHSPLTCDLFVDSLRHDLPVAIFGVGASSPAIESASLIRRANYVSGRDEKSARELSAVVGTLDNSRSRPQDVCAVRDPVLSDTYFTDVNGTCWRKDESHNDDKPLCFVLPSASKDNLQELHRTYSSQVVREGDILLNIFPKHQAEIEAFSYPARVEEILDSTHFATRLCDCRAVVTSRLHGTILSLHAGMPTIAAWPDSEGNKIPSLMKEVLRFPNQFLLTDDTLTRETLDKMTQEVIERYSAGQRFRVFERIETIALHTQKEVERVLATVVHLQLPQGIPLSSERSAGGFWERVGRTQDRDTQRATSWGEAAIRARRAKPCSGGGRRRVFRARGGYRCPGGGTINILRAGIGNPCSGGGKRTLCGQGLRETGSASNDNCPRVALANRSRCGSVLTQLAKTFTFDEGLGLSEGGEVPLIASLPLSGNWFGQNQLRMLELAFFRLKYALWVLQEFGFNICGRTYMRANRNPVALLALQGWVGVGVLCATAPCSPFMTHLSLLPSSANPSRKGK